MDRRAALKSIATIIGGSFIPYHASASPFLTSRNFGWKYDPQSIANFVRTHKYPFVTQQNRRIRGSGKGKKAYLHLALERVMGRAFEPHKQTAPDCVSQAAGLGVDILAAVQIATKRMPQKWTEKAATEPIYWGSRVEIGNVSMGSGGGSQGHWAAEWLQKYGVLHRKQYPGGFDFTTYSGSKANDRAYTGCPDSLEPIAKLHPVKKAAICRSYDELCDLIYNGSPIMVCSNVGFGSTSARRDSEGFLTRKRKPWMHSMLFGGYDDEHSRPGALCFNSWGVDWINGPTRGKQPLGTFWVDASTVNSMLKQGDSFALSAYQGFPRVNIPPYILR